MGARAHQAPVQQLAQSSVSNCWLRADSYPPVLSCVLSDLISPDRLGIALSLLVCNAVTPTRCSARVGEGMWRMWSGVVLGRVLVL